MDVDGRPLPSVAVADISTSACSDLPQPGQKRARGGSGSSQAGHSGASIMTAKLYQLPLMVRTLCAKRAFSR